MKKKFPEFRTDAEAEAFVATADLSAYDFSDFVPVRFELKRKDVSISLRLPAHLLAVVRSAAQNEGMPCQRFIRMLIEKGMHGRAKQAGAAGDQRAAVNKRAPKAA